LSVDQLAEECLYLVGEARVLLGDVRVGVHQLGFGG
jgi:hypothetical protein